MATRAWRPLALASVVTATLAGAVVLRAVLASDEADEPPPAVLVSVTPTAERASPTAEPLVTRVEPLLQRQTFPAGQSVTVNSGIGFLSAETGDLETWSKPGAGSGEYYGPQASSDGALLLLWGDESRPHIIERASGATWRLRQDLHPLIEASHGLVLPVRMAGDTRDEMMMLDLATGTATPLGISVDRGAGLAAFASPDGHRLAVHHGQSLSLLDIPAGTAMTLAEGLPEATGFQSFPGGLGFAIQMPAVATRRWFSWQGIELDRALPPGAVSPNGRYFAAWSSPGGIDANAYGGYPSIGSVVVTERAGSRPIIQALSADPLSRPDLAWTAASDSLVVQVREGYRLVSLSGRAGNLIEDDIHVLDPRPSPTIAGLLGTNRGTIINLTRDQTIAPLYAELPWRASWTTRPGELAVELSTPGKGRDWPLEVLPFELTENVSQPPRTVAVTGSSCANLRTEPNQAASAVRCLPPGATAFIELVEESVTDPKSNEHQLKRYAGVEADDLSVWLHARTPAGESGWLEASALRWQPD